MGSDIIIFRRFLFILFLASVIFLGYFFVVSQDKKTKIVFCDVGQGDASYIRIKNQVDILVDAGPDKKVLTCLGKYMPFYDRKIELAILSHPQKDHFGGFLYLLDRYQIEKMLMSPLDNPSQSFNKLKKKLSQKKISLYFPKAGTKIKILNDSLNFYWPTEEFIAKNLLLPPSYLNNDRRQNEQNILKVLGASSLDDNNFSFVFSFEENNFRVIYTGDATPQVLNALDLSLVTRSSDNDTKTTILKIPHHGSKNGLTKKFLQLANPRIAVISVGKNNSYGHPAKEILEMLQASKIKIKRTDEEGNIIFKLPN